MPPDPPTNSRLQRSFSALPHRNTLCHPCILQEKQWCRCEMLVFPRAELQLTVYYCKSHIHLAKKQRKTNLYTSEQLKNRPLVCCHHFYGIVALNKCGGKMTCLKRRNKIMSYVRQQRMNKGQIVAISESIS